MKIYIYGFLFLIFIFSSCQKNQKKEEKEVSNVHHAEVNSSLISLSREQVEVVGIKLGQFDTIALKNLIRASGMLDLPPQNKSTVSNLLGGVINRIHVIQGDYVKKGQVLATLENPQIIKLQQDYISAKSAYNYATKEYSRQKELFEEKIVAGKKMEAAKADFEAHKSMVHSIENQLLQAGISPGSLETGTMVTRIPIKAPISGYIHRVEVNTGEFVEPAKKIFEIVDNHHIHVDLHVYEKDIPHVKEGQKVFFTLTSDSSTRYEATIFSVGKAFENDTRSVGVHAEITNNRHEHLLPGMYVDGRIQVKGNEKQQVLPDDAIVTDKDQHFIFILMPEMNEGDSAKKVIENNINQKNADDDLLTFKKIFVSTGVTDLNRTEVNVMESIPPGAKVVVEGAYYLDAQLKKGNYEGHDH